VQRGCKQQAEPQIDYAEVLTQVHALETQVHAEVLTHEGMFLKGFRLSMLHAPNQVLEPILKHKRRAIMNLNICKLQGIGGGGILHS
jgi:hypothetical protein